MADAPTITGTRAGQSTVDERSVTPFSAVVVSDPTAGAVDTVVIDTGMPGGTLRDGDGFSGLRPVDYNPMSHIVRGPYELSGSAQQVTAEIDALVYMPYASPDTTSTLTLSVTSDSGAPAATDGTTTVTDVSAPESVSVSSLVDYRRGTFTLTGTAVGSSGVRSVEITALVDGVEADLGAATVDANGNFSFADAIGRHAQSFITATMTDGVGRAVSTQAGFSLAGGLPGNAGEQDRYTADGSALTATDLFKAAGSQRATPSAPAQTFASSSFDTFENGGEPLSTFVFDPGFGRDVVDLFRVDGSDHDTLSFKGADYGGSVAAVLASARDTGAGVVITDPVASSPGAGPGHHDTLLLRGVTSAQLQANPGDIAFHA